MQIVKCISTAIISALMILPSQILAEGTEVLGLANISIRQGSGVVTAGTGLLKQPGSLSINVPTGATVKQVLLYWAGYSSRNAVGDNTITIGGRSVSGSRIGGTTSISAGNGYYVAAHAFRADITNLNLVRAGSNSLAVSNLYFGVANFGAGLVVIYDNKTGVSPVLIYDGSDHAYHKHTGSLNGTQKRTWTFNSATVERSAELKLFFSSVEGPFSGGGVRPNSIEVTIGTTKTKYTNLLGSRDGGEWDTISLPLNIPAGVKSVSVQAFSRNDSTTQYLTNDPASLEWNLAALHIKNKAPEARITGARLRTCQGDTTHITLEGFSSTDPENAQLTYDWTASCTGAYIINRDSAHAQLVLTLPGTGQSQTCPVTLTVSDGVNQDTTTATYAVPACNIDCLGEINGDAQLDLCNVCNGNNDCLGCDGIPNSGMEYDLCGVCGGNNECLDCNGIIDGEHRYDSQTPPTCCLPQQIDECGVCFGQNECLDCAGTPNGLSITDKINQCCLPEEMDACGVCFGDNSCINQCVPVEVTKVEKRRARQVRKTSKVMLDRVNKFSKLADSCDSDSRDKIRARSKRLHQKVINILNENFLNVEDDCGNCEDIRTRASKRRLTKIANKLYRIAKDAKLTYIGVCGIKGGGGHGVTTEDFWEDLLDAIKQLPNKNLKCY